jgi:hypothetical protein
MSNLSQRLYFRPMSTVGILTALHSIFIGLGFLIGREVHRTVLYHHVSNIMSPYVFAGIMIVVGLLSMMAYIKQSDKGVDLLSQVQTLAWFLVSIIYFSYGSVILGITSGLVWTVLSFYSSFSYRNRDIWWSGAGTHLDNRVKDVLE